MCSSDESLYVCALKVSWEAYNKCLKNLGVLVKAKNFLVFQVSFSFMQIEIEIEMHMMLSKCILICS